MNGTERVETIPLKPAILRLREVLILLGVSRSTLYRYVQQGDFPSLVRLGVGDRFEVGKSSYSVVSLRR